MSAERNPREGSENDNVRKLRIVKATEELPLRAIPSAMDWGPSKHWAPDSKPTGSAPSSEREDLIPDDN